LYLSTIIWCCRRINPCTGEASKAVRERVEAACERRRARFSGINGVSSNAGMRPAEVRKFCDLDATCTSLMKTAMAQLQLSGRGTAVSANHERLILFVYLRMYFRYTVYMSLPTISKHIPVSARPFFQEFSVDLLDMNQHASLIMERILAFGNRAEVRWLLEMYGREQVSGWVIQSGMSRLSRRRYHLWCFVFNIPEKNKPVRIWQH
jgi:hypothetical protein